MKTFGISIHGWFMSVFMFLTGKDSYNLPEDTCSLFWQASRMIVLSPITLLGSIFIVVTSYNEDGDGNIWGRIGMSFMVVLMYILLLMAGDSFYNGMFLHLPKGELALSQLSWMAFVYLPIIGLLIMAIPILVIIGIGYGFYTGFVYVKEEYEDALEDKFGLEIDEETDLPKNKFWAMMYMFHNKTCAKITWKK